MTIETTPPPSREAQRGGPAKKKKNKTRAAWVTFIGRVVAQVAGAVASVGLGLVVLGQYSDRSGGVAPAAAAESDHLSSHRAGRASGELALAVLPLQNYSADAAHSYFADGVTEALITDLAQIKGLRVTSRTSSMAYKGSPKPLPDIARELGVDLILEGSIAREGGRVRITAQLIDADTDQHLWARSYDREVRDVLALQADVATAIAREVNAAVAPRIAERSSDPRFRQILERIGLF